MTWPAGLQSLTFYCTLSAEELNVKWPEGLQSLSFRFLTEFPEEDLADSDSRVNSERVLRAPRALRKLVFGNFALVC